MRKNIVRCAIALVIAIGSGGSLAQDLGCELSTVNRVGDYNNSNDADYLRIVEKGHFNSDVQNLIRGTRGAVDPMPDIAYTLRRFPNHHGALFAMSRYHFQNYGRYLEKGYRSPDCYFRLATEWRQSDGVVWLVYGIYLHKDERFDEAVEKYQVADDLMPNSAEVKYNLGLAYVELGEMELARDAAIRAYQLGHPLPGLKNQLKRAGAWTASDEQMLSGQELSSAADGE